MCFAATAANAFLLGRLIDRGAPGSDLLGWLLVLFVVFSIAAGIGLAVDKRWAMVAVLALAPVVITIGLYFVVHGATSPYLLAWWLPMLGLIGLAAWELVARAHARSSVVA